MQNLKNEIKIQKSLNHAHVCKIFSCFEDNKCVYLILDYCEKGNLYQYLQRKKKLTEKEAFIYFFQTCLGIDYIHKNNIIHRDIKVIPIKINFFYKIKKARKHFAE